MSRTEERLNRLADIHPTTFQARQLSFSASAIRSSLRRERLARERRAASKGRFLAGDHVHWRGSSRLHFGSVVEVVPFGQYPDRHPRLRVRGYYRDHESYVVECEDGCFWPRAASLKGVSDGIQ